MGIELSDNIHNEIIFSVVIPLFNKEKHIQRAIRSVLNQTHQNFELIIVDDGSTDNSFEMAASIQDPRVHIIRQQNRGVSAARNRGVKESANEWIAFLDADDEWLPEFLEEIINLIKKYPDSSVAGTGYYLVDSEGLYRLNKLGLPVEIGWEGYLDYFKAIVSGSPPFNSSSFAAKREALLNVGLYPEDVHISEDTAIFFKLAQAAVFAYKYESKSICHREAGDHAWLGFGEEELYATKLGKEILQDPNVSPSLKESLYEYLVRAELGRAMALLYAGKNDLARDVLQFCKDSNSNRERVEKFVRWTKKPAWLYRRVFSIKDLLKNMIRKLDRLT